MLKVFNLMKYICLFFLVSYAVTSQAYEYRVGPTSYINKTFYSTLEEARSACHSFAESYGYSPGAAYCLRSLSDKGYRHYQAGNLPIPKGTVLGLFYYNLTCNTPLSTESGCAPSANEGVTCPSQTGGTNPINIGVGNKYQLEVDFSDVGLYPISASRFYNSMSGDWRFFSEIKTTADPNFVVVTQADGRGVPFVLKYQGGWKATASNITSTLESISGTGGWRYTSLDGIVEEYDANGRLISSTNRSDVSHTYTYTSTNITVTHSLGGVLTYSLSSNGRVTGFTAPDNSQYTYGYDSADRLVSVTYPSSLGMRTYHYENTSFPNALTGITDEENVRFATWAYDSEGRAISSEHHGGAENVTLDYTYLNDANDPRVTSTNVLGKQTTYHFSDIHGVRKVTQVEGHQSTYCAAANKSYTYDTNGFLSSVTDWRGNKTNYILNTKGLELYRTEAAGTPDARVINTMWHAEFKRPSTITESFKQTEFSYDTNGNLTSLRTIKTGSELNSIKLPMHIASADGESTDGWTVEAGGRIQLWDYVGSEAVSHTGKSISGRNIRAGFRFSQRLDLLTQGVIASEIDTGSVTAKLSWWHRSWDGINNDPSRVWFRFFDGSSNLISENIPDFSTAPNQMTLANMEQLIPANSRYMEIVVEGKFVSGSGTSYWVDDFEGSYEWSAQ